MVFLPSQLPIDDSPRWVVREYLTTERLDLGFAVDWYDFSPSFSDVDRNGCTDIIFGGRHYFQSGEWDSVVTTSLGGSSKLSLPAIIDGERGRPYKYHWAGAKLLRAGGGFDLVGMDGGNQPIHNQESFLLFWDLNHSQVLKRLDPPQPPSAGLPEMRRWGHGYTPGDMDGDGYDEFATIVQDESYSWLIALVVDGRTRSYKWVKYFPASIMGSTEYFCPAPFSGAGQDVDLDGVSDLYYAYLPLSNRSVSQLLVLSGKDGSVIWNRAYSAGPQANGVFVNLVGDLDGDGYHDLIDMGAAFLGSPWQPEYAGHLRAISGRNGDILWEHRLVDYDPLYYRGTTSLGLTLMATGFGPGLFPDLNADAVPDLMFEARLQWRSGGKYPLEHVVILSGRDGAPLSMEPFDEDWSPFIPGVHGGRPVDYNIGDWDGDGWPELLSSLGGWHEGTFAIWGRETLRLQDVAHEGERIRARVWIPNGAGQEFRILLADGFDNNGQSFWAGRWDTHLVDGAVLRASLIDPDLRGTLDSEGKATLLLEVPQHRGLAGTELYAVAVIGDPAQQDGVLVKSSLSTIAVLP